MEACLAKCYHSNVLLRIHFAALPCPPSLLEICLKEHTTVFVVDQMGLQAAKVVSVGDSEKADKLGASAVGIHCWLWGEDLKTFADIQKHIIISDS